jgi:hypothetical protein
MRYFALLFIFLIPALASADDASHRAAAGKLIEVVKTQETMRNAFVSSVDALVKGAPGGTVSPAELAEMKQATKDWFDQELDWNGMKSKLEDAYVKSFTEDELNQLTAFYQTPLGQKTLAQLPLVMQQAMAIGQQFAVGKQALWTARLQKIDEKYRAQAALPTAPGSKMAPPLAPLPSLK